MKKRIAGLFVTTGFVFCISLVGCQSGNQDAGKGAEVKDNQASSSGAVEPLTGPQQDALNAFNRGEKALLGVQTRGVSVPGVDEALLPVLRERYGVTLRHVADVIKDQKDRDTITEAFQYVRQYNGKMAELLNEEL